MSNNRRARVTGCSFPFALGAALTVAAPPLPAEAPELALDLSSPAAAVPWTRYAGWPDRDYGAFNTLSAPGSPPAPAPGAPRPLDGPVTGDPQTGARLAFDRSRGGSCVACHVMGPGTPDLPGNVGPDLSRIGGGARPDEYLYNYVYDPRVYNPATLMPPWGAHGVFTEEETRHIVAFLKTLTEPASFATALDDPGRRPPPVEERDNLDPTENPAMWALDTAAAVWERVGPEGESCASCHEHPGDAFAGWAATMPRYESRLGRVLGVEELITRHARATTGEALPMQSEENLALAIYLRQLANGTPIRVDVDSPGAREAAARGRALMQRKIGQLNFACTDCHGAGADKWIRGQWLTGSEGQVPHFPTWRTSRGEIWDIRKRFQWCNVAIRANELAPDAPEYGDIELALTALSNGRALSVPGIRH